MFLREGRVVPELSETGALAAGVPGSLAVYDEALRRFGKLPLKEHLEAAAALAEQGFELDRSYASRLAASASALRLFPASRRMLLREDGSPYKAGDVLRLPDLAATYRRLGDSGTDWFYRGEFALAVETWMKGNGGLIRVKDFEAYKAKEREPIRTSYRGRTILGFPPPSSGGVHVAQILNILETFDLKRMGRGSADFAHVVAEAMKLAFADRAYWLGDPDFAPVPRGLVSKEYARGLAGRIRMGEAIRVEGHGSPEGADRDVFGKHTTHFSVADSEGNWVACTATVNTSFGCKAVIPGTGVVMNTQMDDFSARPGEMNHFGLVGAEANAVAPGKRPLSSMSPTLVLENGAPRLSVGAAGGPTIISQTVLAVIGVVDFGMSPAEALAAPRLHHQWKPDALQVEPGFGAEVIRELEARGHRVTGVKAIGACQAVGWDAAGGSFDGAHDPRVEGKADGW
jgi:gamma-glutamyltranspeptidase/glutathione hydrolase